MKDRNHKFVCKILYWMYCSRCGLISLKNDATRKAMKKACPASED